MKQITTYHFIFWIVVLVLAMQFSVFYLAPQMGSINIENNFLETLLSECSEIGGLKLFFNAVLILLGVQILQLINVETRWCKMFLPYPSLFYLLSSCTYVFLPDTLFFSLCSVGWLVIFYILSRGYLRRDSELSIAFNASFLFSLMSLVDIDTLLFYPFVLMGIWNIRIYSTRSLTTSLMGLLLPYSYFAFTCWFREDMTPFVEHFEALGTFFESDRYMEVWGWILSVVSTILLGGVVSFYHYKERIIISLRIKNAMEYILTMGFIVSVLALVGWGGGRTPIALVNLAFSFVAGRYMSYSETPVRSIVFSLSIVIYLLLFVLGIWQV